MSSFENATALSIIIIEFSSCLIISAQSRVRNPFLHILDFLKFNIINNEMKVPISNATEIRTKYDRVIWRVIKESEIYTKSEAYKSFLNFI
jgi:hypothetical protein